MDVHLSRLSDWRDWPMIPRDLLSDIANRLTVIEDYVSFGRACASWQTIYREIFTNNIFLLVAPRVEEGDDDYYDQRRALYNVSNKRVYDLQVNLPHKKLCRGSCFGWLVTVESKDDNSYGFQLQNPFLGRTIDLPSLDVGDNIEGCCPTTERRRLHAVYHKYRCKVVLSSDPSLSDDFIAAAIMRPYLDLAFYKPGNPTWTPIELENHDIWFEDIIYFHKAKQFYALDNNGSVFAINFDEPDPKLVQIAPPAPRLRCLDRYLIEDLSSGDLLQVYKDVYCGGLESDTDEEEDEENSVSFRNTENIYNLMIFPVFKLNAKDRNWVRIHNLGDKVLFLGNNCSILGCASGCEPNRIYFHVDRDWEDPEWRTWYGAAFEGIYNLEDETIQPHYSVKTTKLVPTSTIWLEPTLRI